MPLIETKKAIMESEPGETIKILIDNDTSVKNVSHYLEDNGIALSSEMNGNIWELTINKGEEEVENTKPEEYCEVPETKPSDYVVMFAKNRIGEGSNELGENLVTAMLESLKAQDQLPSKIMFMNSGVLLVTKGSPVLPLLVELEVNGVELISCGTCLNYFNKMDDLEIGRVTNMFEIVENMRKAANVLNV